MATVFDLAVFKITEAARIIAETESNFRTASLDEFKARFSLEGSPTYGLPPSVLARAMKEAWYDFNGTPRELRPTPPRERE